MADVTKFLMTDETGQSIAAAINAINPNDAVRYSAQTLTDAQKAQARSNIGAISEDEVDVSTKADKVDGATNGNLAGLDSNGNLTDSTIPASDVTQLKNDLSELSGVVSNRNLLDNPWFTVNQRGAETFSTGYFVDRWTSAQNGGTVNSDKSVSFSPRTIFKQYFDFDSFVGTVTLSIKLSNNTILSKTLNYQGHTQATGFFFESIALQGYIGVFPDWGLIQSGIVFYNLNDSASITIKAVKLELGSVSTLANDIAPDYGEELRKCQRYFVRLNASSEYSIIAMGYAENAISSTFELVLPNKLASNNVNLSYTGTLYITERGTSYIVTNLNVLDAINTEGLNVLWLQGIIATSSLNVFQNCVLQWRTASGHLDVSADL